jgi:hypothetical protein
LWGWKEEQSNQEWAWSIHLFKGRKENNCGGYRKPDKGIGVLCTMKDDNLWGKEWRRLFGFSHYKC